MEKQTNNDIEKTTDEYESKNEYISKASQHVFKIIKKHLLGLGSYASVYLGMDQKTNNKKVAIKIEKKPIKHLELESKIIKYLQGGIGIPKYYDYFIKEPYAFLIMEYLNQDIKMYIKNSIKNNIKIPNSTKVNVSIQMLNRIEFLHSQGFIHRDIKPENFCMGSPDNNIIIYLIDFGLCKRYINNDKKHNIYNENENFVGTLKFASVNAHLGVSLSRRDDLESLAYSIIYLFNDGKLPWDKVNSKSFEERNNLIMEIKDEISSDAIYRGLDNNLSAFLKYTKTLKFEETPNYQYLHDLLQNIYLKK